MTYFMLSETLSINSVNQNVCFMPLRCLCVTNDWMSYAGSAINFHPLGHHMFLFTQCCCVHGFCLCCLH